MDPVRVLEQLVAAPSDEREAEVQRVVGRVLERLGFRVRLQEIAKRRPNLLATRGRGGPVMCAHADTVAPFGHRRPYELRKANGRLVGRGSVDAKGQLAGAIAAAAATSGPMTLAVTADKERNGQGSQRIRLPPGAHRSGVLVLEPTGFAVCNEQAGYLDIELIGDGPGGHVASRHDPGLLHRMMVAAGQIGTMPALRSGRARAGDPWYRMTLVKGGEHPWRLPGHVRMRMQVSVLPGTALDEVQRAVETLPLGPIRVLVHDAGPPVSSDGGEILPVLERVLLNRDGQVRRALMSSWTDATNLSARGYPCVIFGAGELGPAHSDEEWLAETDLRRLTEVLTAVIEDWPRRGSSL